LLNASKKLNSGTWFAMRINYGFPISKRIQIVYILNHGNRTKY